MQKLPAEIAEQFEIQTGHCARMGSPLTAAISNSIAKHGLPEGVVYERLANWTNTGTLEGDVIGLRLTGALHSLVLSEADEDLAAQYPPHPLDERKLFEAVCAVVLEHADFIDQFLNSPPQTNEVGRSAVLLPALLQLSNRHHLPFDLYELGASAGLNQGLPQFSYDYGHWLWGDKASPVKLECEWRGEPPTTTDGTIEFSNSIGCDIAPVAIQTEEQRNRLTSYVWPDQPERLARLHGALAIARATPPSVERSGAADWLSKVLNQPAAGHHSLIMHTIMWQYMPADEQKKCEEIIRNFGSKALINAPVSWLRFEADGNEPGGLLSLTHWDGDNDKGMTIDLARADFHGKWIEWM